MKNLGQYFSIVNPAANWIMSNAGFVVLVFMLSLVYIASGRLAEKNVRQIQELQEEVQELRWSYMSHLSELMYERAHSQIDVDLASEKLRLHKQALKKIEIPRNYMK